MFSAAKELHFSILFRLYYFWWGQISARIYLSIMASRRRCGLWPVGWWVPTGILQVFPRLPRNMKPLAELKFKNPFLPVRSLVYGALSPSCCLVDCQWFLFILGRVGRWDDGPRPQHPQNSMESLAVSSWSARILPIWPSILGVNPPMHVSYVGWKKPMNRALS